ncbi:ribosomal protection-like ABC-F family protein [Schinkia azotoformans]|uniref:ribosomal protection-like ABC-F family protein n=1 Tax=Schinkia azotoformans TaxID=1454 RepID=UPI002DBB0440|nr:ABC-F type ribosomal protection protein [Schinkia azotoformans]MEC1714282.1 ABC-F type ribosomal protection protein [Schinkia azotoformans]MEC1740812.1 ABC-F type ribosomal protection protein [Schinkia azotoformans]MEC1743932.1 ABC-F type ribosomal protection protein [Schinkia azotoformans]MEC1758811.1 ABC-F type ribosomal protection protein [Schinkia azotoformans]MEC1765246.1 ABC-F type ribosomal protection protein [Schinkia azotoformans]
MRELLKLQNIGYEVNDITVFEDVNASVQEGDRIGIIGKNGAGKSTLLQLINKTLVPTKGQFRWLAQSPEIVLVEQETENFSVEELTHCESKLLEKWHVPTGDFSQLSGGEKLKARLAKGLARATDLLLLDEPTNHLDEPSKELLKEQLQQFKGTIILVSHDRYFLDEVATKIWSIEGRKLIEHKGNYSSYMDARKQKRLTQAREYEKQQKMVEQIEGQINELTSWSKKAHAQSTKKEGFKEYYRVKAKRMDSQVKSKQKRLEKELEKAKVERVEPEYTVRFSMKANTKVGKRFLEVKNLSKAFDGRTLFKDVNFTIQHGEKLALIGSNGSGKTTLIKIIMGEETAQGNVWVSPSAEIGYLTQEVFDLPLAQTPEQLFYRETFEARGQVQNLMKHLGFTASQWKEPIAAMSMGERVKCKLMAYILEEKDVLILDEPTNHLDLASREQLENTLSLYNGTLLVVSHDRYFLEKTTSGKLEISNNRIHRQWKEPVQNNDSKEELRLKLETERQEVLGKLSFLTPKDQAYAELDLKFNELTKQIKSLGK